MNKFILPDHNARLEALDVTKSFIVRAPAGSGKTELLTNRILALLKIVENPEEILAITFTRKAAAEMRARVIKKLQNPENNIHAINALDKNNQRSWNLIENSQRLRIQTIDAFCSYIVSQSSLESAFGGSPNILPDANKLYDTACENFFVNIQKHKYFSEFYKLLLHYDNQKYILKKHLMLLLAKRQEWLPYIDIFNTQNSLRAQFENNLQQINRDFFLKAREIFGIDILKNLNEIMLYAANNFKDANIDVAISKFNALDTTVLLDLEKEKISWLAICEMLLTKSFTWKKPRGVNKNSGFFSKNDAGVKEKFLIILETISQNDAALNILKQILNSPSLQYTEYAWNILSSLFCLLPILLDELNKTFIFENLVDYNEVALKALKVARDKKINMNEALDFPISHILIDEFQDTSIEQINLLKNFITPNQKKAISIFAVGDPMQSIYRFRNAEVGLFIQTQISGIDEINLQAINLVTNFRSQKNIVNWINFHCNDFFPKFNDVATGAIAFEKASAIHENAESKIIWHALVNKNYEIQAEEIINIIKKEKEKNNAQKIAILIRARSHAVHIINFLKKNNIAYQAVEIENLAKSPVIEDLFTLTKAILNLADRISWLALLRAPYCGFTLKDLHIVANYALDKTIWQIINTEEIYLQLSENAVSRINNIKLILQFSILEKNNIALSDLILQAWQQLTNDYYKYSHAADIETYFDLLNEYSVANTIIDLQLLKEKITNLYSKNNNLADENLQIMTIHKAKGLEFDTVILPYLEKQGKRDENEILLWMRSANFKSDANIIFAPIKSSFESIKDSIYNYISEQKIQKSYYENMRVLYVALTRAKNNLYLIANVNQEEKDGALQFPMPNYSSFLSFLWPQAEKYFAQSLMKKSESVDNNISDNSFINFESKIAQFKFINKNIKTNECIYEKFLENKVNNDEFILENKVEVAIGTLTHSILEDMGENGLHSWSIQKISSAISFWHNKLLSLHFAVNDVERALIKIKSAVENILIDEKAQWILKPHKNAQNEFSVFKNGSQFVIDRTFIDENDIRWIIDYKLSEQKDNDIEKFLLHEQAQYKEQLENYKDILQNIYPHNTIKCALYFPLIKYFLPIE